MGVGRMFAVMIVATLTRTGRIMTRYETVELEYSESCQECGNAMPPGAEAILGESDVFGEGGCRDVQYVFCSPECKASWTTDLADYRREHRQHAQSFYADADND